MLAFPQVLHLWRLESGLTQSDLAKAAGLPRPNLVAIEKGARDVTLGTLRALASALSIKPGLLVDGIAPKALPQDFDLSRERMERIAKAIVSGSPLKDPHENQIFEFLSPLVQTELSLYGKNSYSSPVSTRVLTHSNLWLRSQLSKDEFESLIKRVREHAKKAN